MSQHSFYLTDSQSVTGIPGATMMGATVVFKNEQIQIGFNFQFSNFMFYFIFLLISLDLESDTQQVLVLHLQLGLVIQVLDSEVVYLELEVVTMLMFQEALMAAVTVEVFMITEVNTEAG